jgi:uncharacterized membrane protein YbhN (UPF0104 family)
MFDQKGHARGWQRLRALFHPRVLIATVLGAVILATLLSLSGSGEVWQRITSFPLYLIAILFGLVVGRAVLRSAQWRLFLKAIGIRATRREAFLTLAGGDAAQVLPGGLYFQDVLISRQLNTGVSAPLAATTLMIWMEITVAMLALAALGIPGFPMIRPIMAFCGVGSLGVMLLAHTRLLRTVRCVLCRREKRLGRFGSRMVRGMDTFIGSFEGLSHPKVLLGGLTLCAAYMALTIAGFYLVCDGLGISAIGPAEAAAIYSVVLALIDANPLPSDLGLSELSGVGGFLAFGVDAAAGLAAMLTFRVLLLVGEELVAGAAFALFRQETRRLFRAKDAPAGRDKARARPEETLEELSAYAPCGCR